MLMKLKAIYTLVEQLYIGTQRSLAVISHNKQPPSLIKDVLDKLSVRPKRTEEIKRSAARAGAITALSRAKAWRAELDSEEMATGCPSYKEDESPFDASDFTKCVKEMRPLATKLVEEIDLSKYQAAYTKENKKVKASAYEIVDLIPPIPKHTIPPDVDPFNPIDEEAVFQALTGID